MANADLIGRFVSGACDRALPDDAREIALKCLVDWTGVTLAGSREPVTRAVARYAGLDDAAAPLFAIDAEPEKAALLNGTAAHALDFDDTHIPTDSHFSAVLWATLMAMTDPKFDNGDRMLRAFVAGYDVAAKLSGHRMGFSLQFRWFHPSGVLGRMASAAAASAFLALDADRAAHAVALAMTQASGLRGTLGSMAKPLQVETRRGGWDRLRESLPVGVRCSARPAGTGRRFRLAPSCRTAAPSWQAWTARRSARTGPS